MKIRSHAEQGSALVITLVITAIIGTALASYLKLAEYQNRSVVHSQYWNGGIPIAEAGVEEALAHLNKIGNGNRAQNGWIATNNTFYMARSLDAGKYEVFIGPELHPTVRAVAYVVEPLSGREIQRAVRITNAPVSAEYADKMRLVTVSLVWTNGNVARNRQMQTLISANGLQEYIFE